MAVIRTRVISASAALLISIALAACGGSDGSDNSGGSDNAAEDPVVILPPIFPHPPPGFPIEDYFAESPVDTTPPPPPDVTSGTKEAVADGAVYLSTAIALDSQQRPHVLAAGDDLYHFVRDADGWRKVSSPSIAGPLILAGLSIDADDFLHVFFYARRQLQYATNRSGELVVESLRAYTSTVDAGGKLHVVAYDATTNQLKYGRPVDGRWTWNAFSAGSSLFGNGSSTGTPPSIIKLTIDSVGKAHIVWFQSPGESGEVYYATNANEGWGITLLKSSYSTTSESLDLIVDDTNTPHVTFAYDDFIHGFCFGVCDTYHIQYLTLVEGTWRSIESDPKNPPSSYVEQFAVERPSGRMHRAKLTDGTLSYGTLDGGSWTTEMISSNPREIGEFNDVTVDSQGVRHVGFWNSESRTLEYATDATGTWTTEIAAAGVDIRKRPSIAVDATGNVFIAFIDSTSSEVRYARRSMGTWVVTTIGANADERPSIRVDSSGHAHILYFDAGQYAWMYATNASGNLTSGRLASFDWGFSTDAGISVSAAGLVHVCLDVVQWRSGQSNGLTPGLWLATKQDAAAPWEFERIESLPTDGCVVNAAGNEVHVSYLVRNGSVENNRQLIHTRKDASGWHSAVITSGILQKISMSIAPQWGTFISFYDAYNGRFKYAHDAAAGWIVSDLVRLYTYDQPETLAPLSVSATGQLQTVYFDPTWNDLLAFSRTWQ